MAKNGPSYLHSNGQSALLILEKNSVVPQNQIRVSIRQIVFNYEPAANMCQK